MTSAPEGDKVSFARDIRPLFRARDRDSMMTVAGFDLFEYTDVVDNAEAIVDNLRSGHMPCDGAWPAAQVEKLQHWIDLGMPA